MVVRAWSQVGSGGRKPEVLIKLVVEEGNSRDRERKPRPLTLNEGSGGLDAQAQVLVQVQVRVQAQVKAQVQVQVQVRVRVQVQVRVRVQVRVQTGAEAEAGAVRSSTELDDEQNSSVINKLRQGAVGAQSLDLTKKAKKTQKLYFFFLCFCWF